MSTTVERAAGMSAELHGDAKPTRMERAESGDQAAEERIVGSERGDQKCSPIAVGTPSLDENEEQILDGHALVVVGL
eukprot:7376565-Prymnesium_polylepis.1